MKNACSTLGDGVVIWIIFLIADLLRRKVLLTTREEERGLWCSLSRFYLSGCLAPKNKTLRGRRAWGLVINIRVPL